MQAAAQLNIKLRCSLVFMIYFKATNI